MKELKDIVGRTHVPFLLAVTLACTLKDVTCVSDKLSRDDEYRGNGDDEIESRQYGPWTLPPMPNIPTLPGVSGYPTIPNMPNYPTLPSMPGAPTLPSMPSYPTLPNMPSAPTLPNMPTLRNIEIGDEPVESRQFGPWTLPPNFPNMPNAPTLPNIPGFPTVPSVPGVPTFPGMPNYPTPPSIPGLPTVPNMPGYPTIPNMPAYPTLPSMPNAPTFPNMPNFPTLRSLPEDERGQRISQGNTNLSGSEDLTHSNTREQKNFSDDELSLANSRKNSRRQSRSSQDETAKHVGPPKSTKARFESTQGKSNSDYDVEEFLNPTIPGIPGLPNQPDFPSFPSKKNTTNNMTESEIPGVFIPTNVKLIR